MGACQCFSGKAVDLENVDTTETALIDEVETKPALANEEDRCAPRENEVLEEEPLQLSEKQLKSIGRGASMLLDGGPLIDLIDEEEGITPTLSHKITLETPAEEDHELPTISRVELRRRTSQIQEEFVASAKQNPDFKGVWKMVKADGDFDKFMKEMGVGWALRKAAGAVGYGVGSTYHTIEMPGNRVKVTTKNPKGTFLKDYVIDASEQDDVDPITKEPIKVIPYWEWEEGNNIAILQISAFKPMPKGDPVQMPFTKRYLEESFMVMEQITPEGVVVKRLFEKQ